MKFSEILNLFNQGKATAKSHMKNLIEVAAADGNIDVVEYDLLKSLAKSYGISESKLTEIKNNPEKVAFEVPKDEKEKFYQLYDLVHMMSVDNDVYDEEAKLCLIFAVKFGYPRANVNNLVETIRMNIANGQKYEETMKRCKIFIA